MPSSIADLPAVVHAVFHADARAAGRVSGFVQRASRFDGAALVQTLVGTMLHTATPSLEAMSRTAMALGIPISPQAIDRRLTASAAACLETVLTHALQHVISAPPVLIPLLQRFPGGVTVMDSTTIALPACMASRWPGCQKRPDDAARKLQIALDLLHGTIRGELQPGRAADQTATLDQHLVPAALRIADLGYWRLTQLATLTAQGVAWLSRLHPHVHLTLTDGSTWSLAAFVAAHAP